MNPKISIITVVFNAAKTLEATLGSVLTQTYENIEYVVVDGGSVDGTLDILEKYKSPRLFCKSEPDKGIYDAMNKGISRATGEWIYFLGADDTLSADDIIQQIFSQNIHADFIYGNVFSEGLKDIYDGEFDLPKLLRQNICHQGAFYRKSLFDKIGIFDIRYRLFSDWDFNIKCFLNPKVSIKFVDVVVANYFVGGVSTANNDLPFFREVLFPLNLKHLNKTGVGKLKNISFYDRWWRLLRSLSLSKSESLISFSGNEYLPKVVSRMYLFQQKIPQSLLQKGIFSKGFMSLSFIINRLSVPFK